MFSLLYFKIKCKAIHENSSELEKLLHLPICPNLKHKYSQFDYEIINIVV